MRAPSLWVAVPAFYLLLIAGLCVLILPLDTPYALFEAAYFAAWLLWMSHFYPLMPATNDYLPEASTIVLLCLLVPGLIASIALLKGWPRLSAVVIILFIWTLYGMTIIGSFS